MLPKLFHLPPLFIASFSPTELLINELPITDTAFKGTQSFPQFGKGKALYTLRPQEEWIGDDDDVSLNTSRCQDLKVPFFFQRRKQ